MKKCVTLCMITIMVTVMLLVTGCGKNATKTSTESGKQVNISLASDPGALDPTTNNQFYAVNILNHLYEGLMTWKDAGDGNATIVEGQAASYEVSEDGLTYSFKIRDDAKWSDGQPVKANDFAFAWDRAIDDQTGASYAYMLKDLNATWKAVDESTFEVKLEKPCSYFLEICAFPIAFPVREDVIKDNGDDWSLSPDTLVCNGKYKVEKYDHSSCVTLKKNKEYYNGDKVKADSLKFAFYDDASASLAAYKSGEIDFCQNFPSGETPALMKSGDLEVKNSLGVCYIGFNVEDKVFSNKLIREAFTLAIDRQYLVEKITKGGQVPAGGFVPSGIYDEKGAVGDDFRKIGGDFYDPTESGYEENCKRAKELMKEAGYENGKGLPIIEFQCNFSKEFNEAIKNMWEDVLGVKVNIISEDSAVFLQRLQDGDYQAAFTACIANYNDPITILDIFTSNGSGNIVKYQNPAYDQLIKNAKEMTGQKERMQNLHEAEKALVSEAAVCPVYFISSTNIHKNLKGVYYCPLGYYFFDQCTEEN